MTGVVLLPLVVVSAEWPYTRGTVGLLVLLGTLFTAVPQTLFSASFTHLSAKTVAILATLLPFYGALFGYLIHDEKVSTRTALGGCLILICIIYETVKSTNRTAPDKPMQATPDGAPDA